MELDRYGRAWRRSPPHADRTQAWVLTRFAEALKAGDSLAHDGDRSIMMMTDLQDVELCVESICDSSPQRRGRLSFPIWAVMTYEMIQDLAMDRTMQQNILRWLKMSASLRNSWAVALNVIGVDAEDLELLGAEEVAWKLLWQILSAEGLITIVGSARYLR